MTTVAHIKTRRDSRWYYPQGEACYELPKKDGSGMKKPTLADARKLNLLPSVTTILKLMHKPQLQDWLTEQAVLAVLTTPRKEGESVDEFVHRVLQVERVQDVEADAAAQLGTDIHDAIMSAVMSAVSGESFDPRFAAYLDPVISTLLEIGRVQWVEKVLVGYGYAGRADMLLENDHRLVLMDIKTTRSMPDRESYIEHRMQTAAYAATLGNTGGKQIVTANLYVSTRAPGQVQLFVQEDWLEAFEEGFRSMVRLWQFVNKYNPNGGSEA